MKLTKQTLYNLIQEALSQNGLNKFADLFLSQQMKNIRQASELADDIYNDESDDFWYEENKMFGTFRVSIRFFRNAMELYNTIKERHSRAPLHFHPNQPPKYSSDERITIELHDNLDDVKEGFSPQGSLTIIFSDVFNEKWYEQ